MVNPLWLLWPVAAVSVWERALEEQPNPGKRDLSNREYFVVEIEDPAVLWHEFGYAIEEPFPIKDHWLLSTPKNSSSGLRKRQIETARSRFGVRSYYNSKPSRLRKKTADFDDLELASNKPPRGFKEVRQEFNISDPLFSSQWHLLNEKEKSHDMNVVPVWRRNITGRNVTVAIVDDGLDFTHPDFANSFSLEGSWDFNTHQQLPKPLLQDDNHGTRCAGEIAAGINEACGVGIAPGAKVAGIRILSGELTKADEARALIHRSQVNDIYSCSWGPDDNGMEIDGPSAIVRRAELDGIENGRGGRGSVYVVASGNGDYFGDNCNYDGYTNSIYSITVSAIDRLNQHPFYAESCSANFIVTYSSNQVDKITTSDRMDPLHPEDVRCTNKHSGTSAAAPIAAGIFALVLEKRPELTWRDLQYLCRDTAKKFDIVPNELSTGPPNRVVNDWQKTADGHYYHNSYGFGLLDADAIVEAAERWELVKPQSFYFLPMQLSRSAITPNTVLTTEVTADDWAEANMDHIEHVRVRISYSHQQRGALHFQLMSPSGVVSDLALPRERDLSNIPVHDWEFLSVVHWGETGEGSWKLAVRGPENMDGIVESWQLKFFGQAKDPEKVRRYSEVWNEYEQEVPVVQDPHPPEPEPTSSATLEDTDMLPTNAFPESEEASGETSAAETGATETPSTVEEEKGETPTLVETTSSVSEPTTQLGSLDDNVVNDGPPPMHSIYYYLVVSLLGVIVLVLIFGPLIYCFYKRRIRQTAYARLNEQNIELDNFSDFEIDDDEAEV